MSAATSYCPIRLAHFAHISLREVTERDNVSHREKSTTAELFHKVALSLFLPPKQNDDMRELVLDRVGRGSGISKLRGNKQRRIEQWATATIQ